MCHRIGILFVAFAIHAEPSLAAPCSVTDAPKALSAFQMASSGSVMEARALIVSLDGGMEGSCATCLLRGISTPESVVFDCLLGVPLRRTRSANTWELVRFVQVACRWPILSAQRRS